MPTLTQTFDFWLNSRRDTSSQWNNWFEASNTSTFNFTSPIPTNTKVTSAYVTPTVIQDPIVGVYFYINGNQRTVSTGVKENVPLNVKPGDSSVSITTTFKGSGGSYTLASMRVTLQVTITYEVTTTACIAPTIISLPVESTAPEGSITLSWSGAAPGTNNPITGYNIFRATSENGTYGWIGSVQTTATSGSFTTVGPPAKGDSYYFVVYTIGSVVGYNSQASKSVSVVCDYSAPLKPTSITLRSSVSNADKTSLIVGAETDNNFSILISWSASQNGLNNSVKNYEIYKDGSKMASVSGNATEYQISDLSIILDNHSYTVKAIGNVSGSDSDFSSAVSTNKLAVPPSITGLTSSYLDNKAYDNTIVSWNELSGDYNYILTGPNNYSSTTSRNQQSISLINDLGLNTINDSGTVIVKRRATAVDGGYTNSESSSIVLTKTGAIDFSDTSFWQSYFDSNSEYCVNQYNTLGTYKNSTFYNVIRIYCQTNIANYTYSLQVSFDGTTYNNLSDFKDYYTYSPDSSVKQCYFRAKINDEYGAEAYSYLNTTDNFGQTIKVKFTKITPFNIVNLKVNSIGYNSYTVSYTIEKNPQVLENDAQGSLAFYYKNSLIYNSKKSGLSDNSLPGLTGSIVNNDCNFLGDNVLKNYVNTQYLRNPSGQLTFSVWPIQFPNCVSTFTIDMKYDFSRTLTALTLSDISLSGLKGSSPVYANGSSQVEYNFLTSGVSKLNVFNDGMVSILNSPPVTYEIKYTQSGQTLIKNKGSENSIPFSIFAALQDTEADFELTGIINYNNEDGTPSPYRAWSIKQTIKVAQWTNKAVELKSIKYDDTSNVINALIYLPEGNCGSTIYDNGAFKEIRIIIDDVPYLVPNGSIIQNGTSLTINYVYTIPSGTSKIQYEATFVNTSNDSLVSATKITTLRTGEIDVTIRCGRVGINVPKNFSPGMNKEESTLVVKQRIGGEQEEALMELIAQEDSTYGASIRFLDGNIQVGKIYYDRNNGIMKFDNLYYPPSSSGDGSGGTTPQPTIEILPLSDFNSSEWDW